MIRRDAVGAASDATSDAGTSLVSLTPGDFQGYSQPETIVGVVSGPVRSVSVTGNGAIKCTGTYGTIIGYDALGVELGRQPLALIDPIDCSTPDNPDDVTYGAAGTLTVTNATIARFDITPMSPLEFPVFDLTGHASATYTITLGSAPSISVACTPGSVVRASSTPVACTASASGGALVVTGWTFTPDDAQAGVVSSAQTSTLWTGMAVASGGVTVQGTVGGVVANSETGRITVAARPGWSWTGDRSSGDATPGTFECPANARHYSTGQFGLTLADSTCKNTGLMLWPDPSGISSRRGWTIAKVPSGPNAGLWYVVGDRTGMHIRAQVLKDIRPDGYAYSVGGRDTVATRCKAVRVHGRETIAVVNNTCMTDANPLNFAALYQFAWRHERCHLLQMNTAFPTLPDPRAVLESIVGSDTGQLHVRATYGADGYNDANAGLTGANTIDQPSTDVYRFWSRDTANHDWILRLYQPNGLLAAGC